MQTKLIHGNHVRRQHVLANIFLLVIPVAFAWLCVRLIQSGFFPIYSNPIEYDQDPAYVYLYSGLTILRKSIPQHVDHPGTPFQIFMALLILVGFLFARIFSAQGDLPTADLATFVIQNSEGILLASGVVTSSITILLLFLFGKQIYRYTRSILAALVAQIFVFSWSSNWGGIPLEGANLFVARALYPAPEAMLTIITLAYLTLLTPTIAPLFCQLDPEFNLDSKLRSKSIGVLAAMGLFTKVTFAPILLLLFTVHGSAKKVVRISFIVTSLLFVLFLSSRLDYIASWLIKNAIHSGQYGSGKIGVTQTESIAKVAGLFSPQTTTVWLIFIPLLVGILILVVCQKKLSGILVLDQVKQITSNLPVIRPNFTSVAFLFLLSIFVGTCMLLKNPKVYYYIPTIIIIHYVLSLLSVWVEMLVFASRRTPFNILTFLYAGFAFMLLFNTLLTTPAFVALARNVPPTKKQAVDLKLLARDDYYCTFRIPNSRCSTAFGLYFNPNLRPNPVYKNILYYNVWSHEFENYGSADELKNSVKDSSSINILYKNDENDEAVTVFPTNMKSYLIESGRKYSLWQLKDQ